jgi:hypothetical protein
MLYDAAVEWLEHCCQDMIYAFDICRHPKSSASPAICRFAGYAPGPLGNQELLIYGVHDCSSIWLEQVTAGIGPCVLQSLWQMYVHVRAFANIVQHLTCISL